MSKKDNLTVEKYQGYIPLKTKFPHADYFADLMEDRGIAQDFFKAHLPQEIEGEIDWNTFQLTDPTRISAYSQQLCTDITYLCQTIDHQARIYLHAEAQSTVDLTMPARKMQYNGSLHMKHIKQGNKKLPLIINFVLYNGPNQSYSPLENTYAYYERPDLAQKLLAQPYILINLNRYTDQILSKHGKAALLELMKKNAPRENFVNWLSQQENLVGKYRTNRYFLRSIQYSLLVGKSNAETIINAFTALYPSQKEIIMTAGQQLIQQGLQQGLLTTAKNMLADREPIEKIIKWTGLTSKQLQAL